MFNPEKLISPNEELVIVGRHHSGRTIAAAIVLGNFIKSKKEVADKSLILLLVEYAGDAGFWTFLAKELGLIEKISPSLAADSKKLCLEYLDDKGYDVLIYETVEKMKQAEPIFVKLVTYQERIILIDNGDLGFNLDKNRTKIIRTDLFDIRREDWTALLKRHPKSETIVQTHTSHIPGKKSSLVFNFLRTAGEFSSLTLTYEI